MSLAEYESPILTRQLSWESDSYSEFSHQSTASRGSSESINEQIEEVTSDLNDMLKEVEVLKRSSVLFDSVKDMTGMIEDVGRMSRRNSAMFADDFNVFAQEEAAKTPEPPRYSNHLTPNLPNQFPPRLRHCRSMEVLTERDSAGLVYQGRQTQDLEEQIRDANPWQSEEKVGGIAYTLKIIVVGDAGVGKTSLIHQLTKKQFSEVVMPTLGVDFSAKNLPTGTDNTTIRLHLWDLACIVVFDVTRRNTLSHVADWKNDIDMKCGDIPALLLANKGDLDHDISEVELQRIGKSLNFTEAKFSTAKKHKTLVKTFSDFSNLVKEECFGDERQSTAKSEGIKLKPVETVKKSDCSC